MTCGKHEQSGFTELGSVVGKGTKANSDLCIQGIEQKINRLIFHTNRSRMEYKSFYSTSKG